jgi:hypothetical protein
VRAQNWHVRAATWYAVTAAGASQQQQPATVQLPSGLCWLLLGHSPHQQCLAGWAAGVRSILSKLPTQDDRVLPVPHTCTAQAQHSSTGC